MPIPRGVIEGLQYQGIDEKIAYTILTTPWGGTPVVQSVAAFDVSAVGVYTDVTAIVLPTGSSSVSGDTITLPLLQALTLGHLYRVEVKWTFSGNTFECYFEVRADH